MAKEIKPTVGRQVHFSLKAGPSKGELRAGTIVKVNKDGTVNLQVFTDGDGNKNGDMLQPLMWETCVAFGTEAGQCRWPKVASAEDSEPEPAKNPAPPAT